MWQSSTHFLRAVWRYSHLDPGHYFYELDLAADDSGCLRGDYARAVRTWKSGHYFQGPSLAGLFLRNSWFDSGYMYLDSSWRLLDEFLIFSTSWGRNGSCGRFTACSPGLQHGEVCTVDASISWIARIRGTWNLDIISSAPCIRQARGRCLRICMRREDIVRWFSEAFFGLSRWGVESQVVVPIHLDRLRVQNNKTTTTPPRMSSSLGCGSTLFLRMKRRGREREGGYEKVNSKNSEVKVPEDPVTNLALLARLHGLEESNLMFWIFEFGEEEGLMRAIDEKLGFMFLHLLSVLRTLLNGPIPLVS